MFSYAIMTAIVGGGFVGLMAGVALGILISSLLGCGRARAFLPLGQPQPFGGSIRPADVSGDPAGLSHHRGGQESSGEALPGDNLGTEPVGGPFLPDNSTADSEPTARLRPATRLPEDGPAGASTLPTAANLGVSEEAAPQVPRVEVFVDGRLVDSLRIERTLRLNDSRVAGLKAAIELTTIRGVLFVSQVGGATDAWLEPWLDDSLKLTDVPIPWHVGRLVCGDVVLELGRRNTNPKPSPFVFRSQPDHPSVSTHSLNNWLTVGDKWGAKVGALLFAPGGINDVSSWADLCRAYVASLEQQVDLPVLVKSEKNRLQLYRGEGMRVTIPGREDEQAWDEGGCGGRRREEWEYLRDVDCLMIRDPDGERELIVDINRNGVTR